MQKEEQKKVTEFITNIADKDFAKAKETLQSAVEIKLKGMIRTQRDEESQQK